MKFFVPPWERGKNIKNTFGKNFKKFPRVGEKFKKKNKGKKD